jgi:hypothetical protein
MVSNSLPKVYHIARKKNPTVLAFKKNLSLSLSQPTSPLSFLLLSPFEIGSCCEAEAGLELVIHFCLIADMSKAFSKYLLMG